MCIDFCYYTFEEKTWALLQDFFLLTFFASLEIHFC
jgi:hypothetical protein